MKRPRSAYLRVLETDTALPLERQALDLWLADVERPTRWMLRPLLQFVFAVLLHVTWFLKRLPLPQFSAHKFLQRTICWFCRWFVSREANLLILRHYATESNILNFLRDNSDADHVAPLALYPRTIADMQEHTFVDHDQELFRIMRELGAAGRAPGRRDRLRWDNWRKVEVHDAGVPARVTQILDFETSHSLFMSLFCLLLTAEEYRDAINGFSLDHSIAIRIGAIIGDPTLTDFVYNKYPHYLVGPWNLGQRFLMHGFFTEYLYARLEALRSEEGRAGEAGSRE